MKETVRCDHCEKVHDIDNFVPLTEDEDVCKDCAVDLYAAEIVKLQTANSELLKTMLSKVATIEKLTGEITALKNPWISVEDRLPEKEGLYLCMMKGDEVVPPDPMIVAFWKSRGKFNRLTVTHWMHIPTTENKGGE